ncbi:protein FD-like [Brassica napus]|uniref:protein FD-like n=1 Tax=Brassica napus TaxID=3708 RepID=UPI002078B2AF|nr:protein FD-like [Brassica napus]
MFSSAKHQRNHRVSAPNKNKILNKVPSISSSSSPSHSQVTMEEVWKDINLASIHHLNHHSQHPQHNHEPRFRSHNQNPNSIFQDFLNRPLNQEPTIPTSLSGDTTTVTALFSSSPLAPPATVLSLNSSACFEFLDNQDPLVTPNSNLHSHNHLTNVCALDTPFEALVTSTSFGKKRGQESNEGSGNRRHKRMIKNRESAARSRARKQAYTNELELKLAHLKAENARLKRQQDQLKMVAANQQPKKNTLQRSSTAPF